MIRSLLLALYNPAHWLRPRTLSNYKSVVRSSESNFAYAESEGGGGRGNERVYIIIALIYKFSIVMQFSEA